MATYTFVKIDPTQSFDLTAEIDEVNGLLASKHPGCTADIHDVFSIGADESVVVDLQLAGDVGSAACVDWYSAELVRRGVMLKSDQPLFQ